MTNSVLKYRLRTSRDPNLQGRRRMRGRLTQGESLSVVIPDLGSDQGAELVEYSGRGGFGG